MIVRTGFAAALLAAGALPLAACNSGSAPTPAASPSPTAASTGTPADYGQRVRDLPEGQRAGVFMRAIRDGGENCQEITEAYEIAAIDGNPAWAATCDRTERWIIAFTGEGNASVTKASTASRLPPREG